MRSFPECHILRPESPNEALFLHGFQGFPHARFVPPEIEDLAVPGLSPKSLTFRFDAVRQFHPRSPELIYPFFLKLVHDLSEVNPSGMEFLKCSIRLFDARFECAGDVPVVLEGPQRFKWHRVDRRSSDQLFDVQDIPVARILCARAGPERPLDPTAFRLQLLEHVTAEELLEFSIDELRVCNRCRSEKSSCLFRSPRFWIRFSNLLQQ